VLVSFMRLLPEAYIKQGTKASHLIYAIGGYPQRDNPAAS
jgi:hypothetical protein